MTEPNLLPEFFSLLRNAQDASEECDMFDLHSEDPESMKKWESLKKSQEEALSALISYVQVNPSLLPQVLSLTQ